MTERRLPSGVLTFLAVAVLLLGGAWWFSARPDVQAAPAVSPNPPVLAPTVQITVTPDGALVPFPGQQSVTYRAPVGRRSLDHLLGRDGWVCLTGQRPRYPNVRSFEHATRSTCGWSSD